MVWTLSIGSWIISEPRLNPTLPIHCIANELLPLGTSLLLNGPCRVVRGEVSRRDFRALWTVFARPFPLELSDGVS